VPVTTAAQAAQRVEVFADRMVSTAVALLRGLRDRIERLASSPVDGLGWIDSALR
jgi:hypothetical protein